MKTKHIFYRITTLVFLIAGMLMAGMNFQVHAAANTDGYDTTRIYHAMDRARQGEDITIAVIGGSITAGSLASSTDKRWANLMTAWWIETFPESNVTLVNAGIGGTGSDIGVFRLQRDVLSYDPDFIVVEFSVNDSEGELAEKMMEGLIQQTLMNDSMPGIMLLLLKQQSGVSAQLSHKLVGNHYDVPMVSFADSIDDRVAGDGYTLDDIFVDGLHPNDQGMQYIADFLIEELELIHSSLPAEGNLPPIPDVLPDPLITDTYGHTYLYTTSTLIPDSSNGWNTGTTKWSTETEGSEINFLADGNAVSFIYTRHNIGNRGQVEAWIDDGTHQTYDGNWSETWGPAQRLALVQENLSDGEHILHIRVLGTTTSSGHYFEILNVGKAGNFEGAAPIAKAGPNQKVLINTPVTLDGSGSFDPDGDSIETYEWSVSSFPVGSIATIASPAEKITEFTPDIEGLYLMNLVVGDGIYTSVENTKKLTVKGTNATPVANAGNDTTVATSQFFFLNGSLSNDPDGDLILYSWELISQPIEGYLNFNFLDTPHPRVFPINEGEYIFSLVVNDSIISSEEDLVTVTAVEGYMDIQNMNRNELTLTAFPNPTNRTIAIQYEIPSTQFIKLGLYTLSGSKIAVMVNEIKTQGIYSVEIDLDNYSCSQGVYILKMICENEIVINRIVKMK